MGPCRSVIRRNGPRPRQVRKIADRCSRSSFRMSWKLTCTIANFVPGRLFGNEFVEPVPDKRVFVETMRIDGKGGVVRQRFSKRRSATTAKGAHIGVRRFGLETRNVRFTAHKFKLLPLDEDKWGRTQFPAPGTVACSHHARLTPDDEAHSAATTAAQNLPVRILHACRPSCSADLDLATPC